MNLREFVISIKLKMAEARGRMNELKTEFSKAADAAKKSGEAIEGAGNKSEKAFDGAADAAARATKANKENEASAKANAKATDGITSSWGKMGAIAGKALGSIGKGFKDLRIPTKEVQSFSKALNELKGSSTPLGMLTKGFLGLSAATLGARGLMEFFANTVNNDASVGRSGRNMGVSPSGVNAWGAAFQANGGTQQDAAASIARLTDAFTSYKMTGSMQGINEGAMMKLLGVNYRNIMSQGGEKTMYALAGASKRFSAPEYSWLLGQLGLSDSAVSVLSKGEDALKQFIEDAKRANKITVENTKAAQEFQEAWQRWKNSEQGFFAPFVRGLEEISAKALKAASDINEMNTHSSNPNIARQARQNRANQYSQEELHAENPNVETGFWHAFRRRFFHANEEELKAAESLDKKREEASKNGDDSPTSPKQETSTLSEIQGYYNKAQKSKSGGDHTALDLNNPGGIVDGDFARRQPGYMGGDGHFARFRTLEDGINAERTLLKSYLRRGYDTPNRIAYKWASGRTDDPATYAQQLAQKLHITADTRIDPSMMEELVKAIAGNENSGINGHGASGGMGGGAFGGIQNHFHGNFVFNGSSGDPQDHARQFSHEVNKQMRASSFNTGQE